MQHIKLVEQVDFEKSVKNVHPIYAAEEENSVFNEDLLITIKSEPKPVIIDHSDSEKNFPYIPYVVYSKEQNPWDFIDTELSTDHIYKSLV